MFAKVVLRSTRSPASKTKLITAATGSHVCHASCICSYLTKRQYSASTTCQTVDWKNRPGIWDEPGLESMTDANKKWIEKTKKETPAYFDMNQAGHFPKMLWIGCVDARVPANELIGEPAGSIFVHRNVANQVINTDMSVMSILHFAVDYHKVKHIVVCGHHDCGGVKAALTAADHGSPLENWVRNIRDVVRLHRIELNSISELKDKQRRLTELNVIESCRNLFKTIHVQRSRHESAKTQPFKQPQIHACVFEPGTGELKRLPLDLEQMEAEMKGVYGLV